MPAFVVLNANHPPGDPTPEQSGIAGAVLEDTLVAEVQLVDVLDGRIGYQGIGSPLASIDRFFETDFKWP